MLDNRELREKVEDHALALQRFLNYDRQHDALPSQYTHDLRSDALDDLTKATRAIINHVEEWPQ
jgi:hypothetical protein